MTDDNDTIEQVCADLRGHDLVPPPHGAWVMYADRILAAHKREMAHNESLLRKAGETVVGLMNKMSAQNEEIKKLRKLVTELADALEERLCDFDCEIHGECLADMKREECESFNMRPLVAKAREVANG